MYGLILMVVWIFPSLCLWLNAPLWATFLVAPVWACIATAQVFDGSKNLRGGGSKL